MKTLFLLCTMAGAMSAQEFHGVSIADGPKDSVSGNVMPVLVNNSAKAVIGFATLARTQNGPGRPDLTLGFNWMATGTPILPGTKRALPHLGIFTFEEEADQGYKLEGVLFEDGTFFGSDEMFARVAKRVEDVRSMARDTQYLAARHEALVEHAGKGGHPAAVARFLLRLEEQEGPRSMDVAIGKLAALPDVRKGEE